jgi:predicted enzyme related to lactoylglutathione lyase
MSTTVNWFEIPVQDINQAAEFYGTVLDTPLGEMDGPDGDAMRVFLGDEGPSGTLVQADAENSPAANGTLVYLSSEDIDAALERAGAAGGQVQQPKTPIGPFGFIGRFLDPDGNRVALHTPS